jgi:GH43 family beta-xylosidase
MSQLIWAPELHHIDGKWYIYFAATHTQALDALGMFQHRMFAWNVPTAIRSPARGWKKGRSKRRSTPSPWTPPPLCIRETLVSVGAKSAGYLR